MATEAPSPSDARTSHAEPWWNSAVVYQVYLRSFQDSDGDGVGDIPGLISRLDHLQYLGVDVVWLSPVFRSPQADNGYDVSDYLDIDPLFGTLADLDNLISKLHERSMRLVLDIVVNHTSDQHPWFAESRSHRDSDKRDWYFWRPPRPVPGTERLQAEPNNWASYFSGPAWTLDTESGEYYLHLFTAQQPDLNWSEPAMRQAVYAMMRSWVARGVDGFRMDVINYISKVDGLPDAGSLGSGFADGAEHFTHGPRLHEYLQELRHEVFADHPDRAFLIGETPGATVEEASLYTDPARGELDMVFQFEHVELDHGIDEFHRVDLPLPRLKSSLARWQEGLADVGWNSLYWNNHDQPRAVSRFGDPLVHRERSAKTLALVLHLLRGTPYIYQGEELGMTDARFGSLNHFRDVASLNYYNHAVDEGCTPEEALALLRQGSRDNGRTTMPWEPAPHGGFTTGVPWIWPADTILPVTVEEQRRDPESVLNFYRRLIALRHTDPVVVQGTFKMLLPADEQLFVYERAHDGLTLLVVGNLSGTQAETVEIPLSGARLVLSTVGRDHVPDPRSPLEPWEARLYRTST